MQDFRKLLAWERAQCLAVAVCRATEGLSNARTPGLRSQLRRASASVAANIAEGAAAESPAQFARYLQMAIGSVSEVESHLDLSARLGVLAPACVERLTSDAQAVRRICVGLRVRVLERGMALNARSAADASAPTTDHST
jgi:four helix bundle protein